MLTAGVDAAADFTGGAGDDIFNAATAEGASGVFDVETLTALDNINGGLGNDVLNVASIGTYTLPSTIVVQGIETANFESDSTLTADVYGCSKSRRE